MKSYLNKRRLLILFFVPLLISCIQERLSSNSKGYKKKEQYKVSFLGNYAKTKSASAFPSGVVCSIFTYYSGENPLTKQKHPSTPITVISSLSGRFVTTDSLALYLAPNSYDFYAISANSSTLNELTFQMGKSNRLNNGVDYLWSQRDKIKIENQTEITFNFKHLATSIIIDINPQINSLNKSYKIELNKILIGVPDSVQTLTLASGEINSTGKVSTPTKEMNINGNRASYIILPLQDKIDIPIELYVTLSSKNNSKKQTKYSFSLPSPTNGFKGGTQYKYRVKINNKMVVFEKVSIEGWNRETLENIEISEID